jgi:hypothetical protein
MKYTIKQRFDNFINSDKDYPLLVGFLSGLYPLVFFYSNNLESINSLQHLVYFIFLFLVAPAVTTFILFKIVSSIQKIKPYKKHLLFVIMIQLTGVFLSQVYYLVLMKKKLLILFIIALLLSIVFYKHYKKLIVFVSFLCVLPIFKIANIAYINFSSSSTWQNQPDAILDTKFKRKPNIYYIQPDGYANNVNLKGSLYQFDNSEFDSWLDQKKFTLYNDYRSNYESTLYSNLSCFYMKHHFYKQNSNFKYARNFIVGENPVIKIFKNNNYKTFLITERPHFLINKPRIAYDYCNFELDELSYFDAWANYKDITDDVKKQVVSNTTTNNFFFIEKFTPSHISIYETSNLGKEKERLAYIERLKMANIWLKDIVSFLDKNDPNGIIIIGADHGGFVGFDYTEQAYKKISDKKLLQSIFGAKLAIKWNDSLHYQYDTNLKSAVNLFRVLFSDLSQNKSLLKNVQPNISYNLSDPHDISKIYLAIE